jgi:uncharacterized protein YecE (DUF72 family)
MPPFAIVVTIARPYKFVERTMSRVVIGTSGWAYDGWRGDFFPNDIPKKDWLRCYASVFTTTEINASFYRTPSLEAVQAWREQTPRKFLFTWKASKFITHWKRLTEKCDNSIALMETRLDALSPKVAAVLFQLPPQFERNTARLDAFLHMLPNHRRYAFEFRHKSWYADEVLAALHRRHVALCLSDHHDAPTPWETTARFVYIRGHGPQGRYAGRYPVKTMQRWADAIMSWKRRRMDVLVYFDNDQKVAAPKDALRLIRLLEQQG